MNRRDKGSTLIENIISITILLIYVLTIGALTTNLLAQQTIKSEFIKMNASLESSVEEILNKKYADIPVGVNTDTIDGFNRTTTVTEDGASGIKEITIELSNSKGEMSIVAEKGQDIN